MVRYGIQTTEYTKCTKWIRIYNSRKVRNVRKGCGAFPKKNFADFANFARGKTIRTLFYTFLHVLHGQKFNRLFVYLVYFVVNQTTTNNKTRKEKLQ